MSVSRTVIKGLCPPDVVVVSPPSCAPSLHLPSAKRCKLTGATAAAAATSADSFTESAAVHKRGRPMVGAMAPLLHLNPPPGSVSLPNSPCGEGSTTMQRTLLIKHAGTMTGDALAAKLSSGQPPILQQQQLVTTPAEQQLQQPPPYLLVDCRPFIAYNVSHIRGAINVNCCNRLNRKRLQMGKATLADLATTKEGKEVSTTTFIISDKLEKVAIAELRNLSQILRNSILLIGGAK